ncbi:EAL domain-containing protein [Gluconacetobacter diazotrophicus]|uniref:EAL domain-containing protein n=1 Tax=Gluconacetobacter diazotrophicus TaxID=33996 RepID=UPI0002E0FC89|nr:EAL domain-containing protein [Gluconacetobacter diazotrophicus]
MFDGPSTLPVVLAGVLDAMPGGVVVTDADGRILFINRAAARLCGGQPEEWASRSLAVLLPDMDMTPDGTPREVRLAGRDGAALWLEVTLNRGGALPGVGLEVPEETPREIRVAALRDVTDEVARRTAAHLFSTIVNHAGRGVMVLDDRDRIVYVNPAFTRLLDYRPEDVVGRDVSVILSPDVDDRAALGEFRRDLHGRRTFGRDLHARSRSGQDIWMSTATSPVRDGGVLDGGAIVILSDETPATELQHLRLDVTSALAGVTGSRAMDFDDVMTLICARIEAIAPGVMASIILLSGDGTAWMAGRAAMPDAIAAACDGFPVGPMAGTCGAAISSGQEVLTSDIETDPNWTPAMRDLMRPLGVVACWSVPIRLRGGTVAGSLALYFQTLREPSPWHRRVVDACIQLCTLAVEQERARAQIAHLAHYDAVTGLPNRTWLREHLAARQGAANWCGLTLMSVDVNRYREIRDALGGAAADEVLGGMAKRLRAVVGQDDILVRTGEDEFSILTDCGHDGTEPECRDRSGMMAVDRASTLAGAILRALASPVVVNGMPIGSPISIGICAGRDKGRTVETLLRHTQIAVSRAREAGGSLYRFFSPEMNRWAQDRVMLASALGDALADGRLRLVYQPQVRSRSGALYGVEALARWHDPEWGDIPPTRFIPMAEEAGLIEALGEWALRQACRQMAIWMAHGVGIPVVSVNLSARHFSDPGLPGLIGSILEESGIPPGRLMVEITESTMITDSETTIAAARAIRALGVGLSMDDFGTGFSSLANLVSLPLSEVKIDRAFVVGLERAGDTYSIVNAVLRIGQSLGVTVVAEGVETQRQLDLLDGLDCPVVQGFLMSRPLDAGKVPSWLEEWHRSRPVPEALPRRVVGA